MVDCERRGKKVSIGLGYFDATKFHTVSLASLLSWDAKSSYWTTLYIIITTHSRPVTCPVAHVLCWFDCQECMPQQRAINWNLEPQKGQANEIFSSMCAHHSLSAFAVCFSFLVQYVGNSIYCMASVSLPVTYRVIQFLASAKKLQRESSLGRNKPPLLGFFRTFRHVVRAGRCSISHR